jgi:hypothetical protein
MVFGLGLAGGGVGLSVLVGWPYFYAFLVVGLFLFFDGWLHVLQPQKSLKIEKISSFFLPAMMTFILLTDLLSGQVVFKAWSYPAYWSFSNWIVLYAIIYPVGGLSLIASYRLAKFFLDGVFSPGPVQRRSWQKVIIIFSVAAIALLTVAIFMLHFLGGWRVYTLDRTLYDILVIILLLSWALVFDAVALVVKSEPLLYEAGSNISAALAIVITAMGGAAIHEIVNTFSREWIYDSARMPFSGVSFAGVPVFIYFAWIPMTYVCVSLYKLTKNWH